MTSVYFVPDDRFCKCLYAFGMKKRETTHIFIYMEKVSMEEEIKYRRVSSIYFRFCNECLYVFGANEKERNRIYNIFLPGKSSSQVNGRRN